MSTPYDYGIYILQVYAGAASVSPPAVLASYKSRYGGNDAVASIGSLYQGLNVGEAQKKFRQLNDDQSGGVDVSQADMNQIAIDLGAQLPAVTMIAAEAVAQTAGQVVAVSSVGLGLAAVAGLVYVLFGAEIMARFAPRA